MLRANGTFERRMPNAKRVDVPLTDAQKLALFETARNARGSLQWTENFCVYVQSLYTQYDHIGWDEWTPDVQRKIDEDITEVAYSRVYVDHERLDDVRNWLAVVLPTEYANQIADTVKTRHANRRFTMKRVNAKQKRTKWLFQWDGGVIAVKA